MAEVFEAELLSARGFARRVAIKRMAEQIAHDPSAAARFLEEARIASSLHHAGIVAVLDFGVMDGTPFQVLELVEGLNADQLIDRSTEGDSAAAGPPGPGPTARHASHRGGGAPRLGLPTDIALIIASDVAHALHHAHEATDAAGHPLGIVHRDVKPSNVLVSWAGDVKLTDFGIAFARGRAIQTETGLAPGSWAFMAPEQRGRAHVDRRADVFALGCTLYALLTGESPQRDLELAVALDAGTPLPLPAPLDDDVRRLLARALHPRAAARPASCGELAGELGAALARRLSRDPRGRLQEFLASLRAAPTPRGGLLDQLLAVELVLTAEHDAVRQFELRPSPPLPPPPPARADAPPGAIPPPPTAPTAPPAPAPLSPPHRWRRRAAPGLAGAGLLAGLGALAWRLSRDEALPLAPTALAAQPASATAPPPAATGPAAAPDAAPDVPDAAPADTTGSSITAAAPASNPPARPHRRGAPRHDAAPPVAAPPPPAPAASAAPLDTGYLRVIARDREDRRLINARIYVDGVLRGYAPDPISAPVGAHRVRVVLEDDVTDLGTFSVEIKPDHRDRGHPATLRVP